MRWARRRRFIDVADVRERARGQWDGILARLAPELEPALAHPGRHVACPVHGGQDGFRVFRDVAQTGGGICNTCGAFRDGFALLQWSNDWDFATTLEAVAQVLGVEEGRAPARTPTLRVVPAPSAKAQDTKANEAAARRVWGDSLSLDDPRAADLVGGYLVGRGLAVLPDPRVVRLHPALGYYQDGVRIGTWPAMLAKVSDPTGRSVTLHRTYLSGDGGKAPVEKVKKLMRTTGPLAGAAIRLQPRAAVMGIAEGIETALAVHWRTGMPVWAATTAVLLEQWEPPENVRRVVVWADLDRSGRGEEAAATLQQRLTQRGIRTDVWLPNGPIHPEEAGRDWADVFRE